MVERSCGSHPLPHPLVVGKNKIRPGLTANSRTDSNTKLKGVECINTVKFRK